jgi:uncharacterized protein YecE (DUF72 family)
MGETRIGISGWTYPPWRGRFYPKGWPQHRELEYASRQVSSIEINGSFYSLQRPESYGAWYDASPGGFVFSIKGSRFITHMKRLKDVETPLANFFASGVLRLEEKLGPFLWQLPPSFRFDPERLRKFFNLLPRDTWAAANLAKKHDERLHGRAWTKTDRARPLRHAIEVRHSSFETRKFIALLREHDIAMVVADTARKWPLIEDSTSDFVYVRLHGDEELYVSGGWNGRRSPGGGESNWSFRLRPVPNCRSCLGSLRFHSQHKPIVKMEVRSANRGRVDFYNRVRRSTLPCLANSMNSPRLVAARSVGLTSQVASR